MTSAGGFATARTHGGPDAGGPARFDFSSNSNAAGPCAQALAAVQRADPTRYPDAGYTVLRRALAQLHAVAESRIALAGSASEFIFRISAWVARRGGCHVSLPPHAYGDYAEAALAWGLQPVADADAADLVWACEPSSPLGQSHQGWPRSLLNRASAEAAHRPVVVLDRAYAPLRLDRQSSLDADPLTRVWQLFSPNKALGLTGVRAAYAIAPVPAQGAVAMLDALAPSWVVGSHGVAMLMAWSDPAVQDWVQQSLLLLAQWKQRQSAGLQQRRWQVQASEANFFCTRPPTGVDAPALCQTLRRQGLQLRDTTSFGLPGWVRLGVLPPPAQDALFAALASAAGA